MRRRLNIPDKFLPPPLVKDEAAELYARLPDASARERLMNGHLRLVAKLALELCEDEKNRRIEPDDLFGVGQIALVLAVDNLTRGDTVTSYIAECVQGAMKNACDRRRPGDYAQVASIDQSNRDIPDARPPRGRRNGKTLRPDRVTDELASAIDDACRTVREREIVRMLGEGRGQDEIRRMLKVSIGTVNRDIAAIRTRLNDSGFDVPDNFQEFSSAG
jgi:RNA polymerase sigma factor (sigma-70 family)